MCFRWRLGRFLSAALAVVCSASRAPAQLLVVTTEGEPPALAHAELAYATGEGPPVTWLALRMQRGPVAVVAALPAGVTVEPALDAWFAALEASASPNILMPRGATGCADSSHFVHVSWPRDAGVPADELRLGSADDAAAALSVQGFRVPELPSAERYVVWSWPAADAAQTTRTLRLVGAAAPLTFSPGSSWPVLLTRISHGPTAFPAEVGGDALDVTFFAGKPDSDYHDRVRDWLGARKAPLLEARAQGLLFDWSIYADTVSLPPLVRSYALAARQESVELDPERCVQQLRSSDDVNVSGASACADALDASLALRAAEPRPATLQRFVLSGAEEIAPDSAGPGGEPSAPVLRASKLELSGCPGGAVPEAVALPPAPRRGGSSDSPPGTAPIAVEETVVVDETSTTEEAGCGSSPGRDPYDRESESWSCGTDSSSSTSSDACSGDSSSSGETDEGCSGDSTSTKEEDTSCSSDSKSSRDSGDGCGADSSSSSSDSSCSGSSDSSYDGDTCTGSAAPGAERTKKAQANLSSGPARPRRLKLSLWSLAFAAVLLPIRRRNRQALR